MTKAEPAASPQFPLFEVESGTTDAASKVRFSDYIVYVDESGDHGMASVDPIYPVFVLSFCVFHKRYYSETVVPALEKFKFNYFGHDLVVLHEHEIRKETGVFNFFRSRGHQQQFIADLTGIIDTSNFILISCVIDKLRLQTTDSLPPNPYHLALGFCIETLYQLLLEKNRTAQRRIFWSSVEARKRTTIWNWSFDEFAQVRIDSQLRYRSRSCSPIRKSILPDYN